MAEVVVGAAAVVADGSLAVAEAVCMKIQTLHLYPL